jgi:GNAT superfamily N-acetyltransferase
MAPGRLDVSARMASSTDLVLLAELLGEGVTAATQYRGSDLWLVEHAPHAPFDAYLRSVVDDPTRQVLAGCVDDVPVGVLLVDRRLLPDQRSMGRISFVYVHSEARSIGVGEALVHAALRWAREQGCVGMDGVAFPGDRETKNLYERAGLTARAIVVHRSFRDAGPW